MENKEIIEALRCWCDTIVEEKECRSWAFGENCTLEQIVKKTEEKLNELQAELNKAIKLPCHVGDIAYIIVASTIEEYEITSIQIGKKATWIHMVNNKTGVCASFPLSAYKKAWFLDKKEAKQKLKKHRSFI